MSDAQHTEHEANHEGPIRTPKQLINKIAESGLIQETSNAIWLGTQIESVHREIS